MVSVGLTAAGTGAGSALAATGVALTATGVAAFRLSDGAVFTAAGAAARAVTGFFDAVFDLAGIARSTFMVRCNIARLWLRFKPYVALQHGAETAACLVTDDGWGDARFGEGRIEIGLEARQGGGVAGLDARDENVLGVGGA